MMHDIAVRCGDGSGAAGFGVPKVEHGEYHSVGFGEGNNLSTRTGAIRVVVSRMGGTSTQTRTRTERQQQPQPQPQPQQQQTDTDTDTGVPT